jgi:hypothetical protein
MYTILLAFLLGPCERPPAPVIVVADGSRAWQGQTAKQAVVALKAELGPCYAVREAWFDAEPALHHRFRNQSEQPMVTARTPMRDAMEAGLARLIDAPRPHTMVVIAHEQFYPTAVSTSRLLELTRGSETRVHTIHLASGPGKRGLFRRFGASLRGGAVWLVETSMGERGYANRDTARFLTLLADESGGSACEASCERAAYDCAKSIAAEIMNRAH